MDSFNVSKLINKFAYLVKSITWEKSTNTWRLTVTNGGSIRCKFIQEIEEEIILYGLNQRIVTPVKIVLKLNGGKLYSKLRKRGEADGRFICIYITKKLFPKIPNRLLAKLFKHQSPYIVHHAIRQVESIKELKEKLQLVYYKYPGLQKK